MPISEDEWDEGATSSDADASETTPASEYETEKDLIVAFLSENHENAYTRAEIVRGVDFGEDADPETIRDDFTEPRDELVDLAGEVVASGMVVDDVDAALDELVDEGTVVEKEVETDGGTETYYRLNSEDVTG